MPGHQYKLTYFNVRGRGEIIRLVFAAAGQKYEDHRIEREQWPELKPQTPFGQIPMLEVDGTTKLCQSNAISKYLAEEFGLAGKTPIEKAQAHMVIECLEDMGKAAAKFRFEPDETKKAEYKKTYIEEQLPKFLGLLEKIVKENHGGNGFIVGDGLTWADLAILNMASWMKFFGTESQLAQHEKLSALIKRVAAVPNVAEWLEKRPVTEY